MTREIALKTVFEIIESGEFSNIVINKYIDVVKEIDKAFYVEIVYGVIRYKLTLDEIINKYSKIKIKKISPWILNILRLGIFQILYMDKVPISAACNESVKLAKKYGHIASSGFVNAILRNIRKTNIKDIFKIDKQSQPIKYLSLIYAHPEWMIKNWYQEYGLEFTEQLLAANNEIPPITIRVNKLKTTKQQLIKDLKEIGIDAVDGQYIDQALIIRKPLSLFNSKVFHEGHFYVQDESSMLAVKALDPKSNEVIIDVCSAPGGKATYIAELMENKGRVIARDFYFEKLNLIQENANKLGINIIKTENFDATQLDENLIGKADRVLIDAPCTGFGIIRKKPEIKWNRNADDTKSLSIIQQKIINTCSKYVKPGGILVYSTCTIQKEENQDIIKNFLSENKNFNLIEATNIVKSQELTIQLLPNIHKTDGFFIAKMQKFK